MLNGLLPVVSLTLDAMAAAVSLLTLDRATVLVGLAFASAALFSPSSTTLLLTTFSSPALVLVGCNGCVANASGSNPVLETPSVACLAALTANGSSGVSSLNSVTPSGAVVVFGAAVGAASGAGVASILGNFSF